MLQPVGPTLVEETKDGGWTEVREAGDGAELIEVVPVPGAGLETLLEPEGLV